MARSRIRVTRMSRSKVIARSRIGVKITFTRRRRIQLRLDLSGWVEDAGEWKGRVGIRDKVKARLFSSPFLAMSSVSSKECPFG